MLGAHRNALGTFHHDQKHRLMAARKAWFKLSKKLRAWALSKNGRSDSNNKSGSDPPFFDVKFEVSATKTKKETKHCVACSFRDHETETQGNEER